MKIEQHDGYTVIDRRWQPCRTCGCPDRCHTQSYVDPTMECIRYLRQRQVNFDSVTEFLINRKDRIAFTENDNIFELDNIILISPNKDQDPGLLLKLKKVT